MIPEGVEIIDHSGKVLQEDDVRERLNEFRKLIKGNNKLEKLRTDDTYLLRFLHCSKFDVNEAHKRMEMFYELLVEFPDWYHIGSPFEKKDLLHKNMRLMLNDRDRDGRSIYLCKFENVDPSKVTIKQVISVDDMWLEMALDDPMVQCKGLCVIMDVSGYSWKLFQWLTPGNLKFGSRKVDAMPFTDLLIHVVNTSFLLDASIKIVWPFLPSRIKQSIKFHNTDWPSLHKYISPDVLPPEYGGTANISYDKLNEKLIEKSNEYTEKTKYIDFIVSSSK